MQSFLYFYRQNINESVLKNFIHFLLALVLTTMYNMSAKGR